jgi:hypothetical protein
MSTPKPHKGRSNGRPQGSRYPDRITDRWVLETAASLGGKSPDQLACLQSLIAAELRRLCDADTSATPEARMKKRIIAALLDVERALLLVEGSHLTGTAQYTAHKRPGDPSMATIYRHFDTFTEALVAAGLRGPQAAAELTRRTGRGRGRPDFTQAGCVRAMAAARERWFLGRHFSVRAYDRFRSEDAKADAYPSSETICGHAPGDAAGGPWSGMHDLLDKLILSEPHNYPISVAALAEQEAA